MNIQGSFFLRGSKHRFELKEFWNSFVSYLEYRNILNRKKSKLNTRLPI